MAAKRPLQGGTRYGRRVSYYRQGSQRTVSAGGWTAGRSGGQTVIAAPGGSQLSVGMPGKAYHRIILAEFLGCLVMIGAGMILIPAQGSGKTRSFARELVQLSALCAVFFILALAGGGAKTGKVAAAFGGLVTLGVAWHLSQMWGDLATALGAAAGPAKKAGAG